MIVVMERRDEERGVAAPIIRKLIWLRVTSGSLHAAHAPTYLSFKDLQTNNNATLLTHEALQRRSDWK